MINAPITPGIQPQSVNRNTIATLPHPRSTTANGGKIIANSTCKQDIIRLFNLFCANFGAKVQNKNDICK